MSERSAPQLCMVHVRKVSHPAETQYRGEVHYTFGPCGRPLPCSDHPAASVMSDQNEQATTDSALRSLREAITGITPLPWTADEEGLFIFAGGAMETGFTTTVADSDEGVARMRGFGSGQPQERNLHAIAAVMNAAPLLLAELESLRSILNARDGESIKEAAERVMQSAADLIVKYGAGHRSADGEEVLADCWAMNGKPCICEFTALVSELFPQLENES